METAVPDVEPRLSANCQQSPLSRGYFYLRDAGARKWNLQAVNIDFCDAEKVRIDIVPDLVRLHK